MRRSRDVHRANPCSAGGFTIIELIVAMGLTVTVMATLFTLLDPAQGIFRVQPEVADLQQRLRVGVDVLTRDVKMAGAGTDTGETAGPLLAYLAPVLPYRIGFSNSDAVAGRWYRPEAITVLYVPPTASYTTIREPLAVDSRTIRLNAAPNCPKGHADQLCGFEEKARVLLFNAAGAWDIATVSRLEDPALTVDYAGTLSTPYAAGSTITQIVSHTYYLKADAASGTFQLMHYDGYQTDLPVIDHAVALEFSYLGEPQPPTLRPGLALEAPGAATTYGPEPPSVARDNPDDQWPSGENCVFAVDGGAHRPRLPVLAAGVGLVPLTRNMLTDGPWCPDAAHVNRFDADLLRIRRVRVTVRVQAATSNLRGPAGVLFSYGGTARGGILVPDHQVSFDITPRNVAVGR